jgi:4-amino-4-deoxy-L-arabinose transferase-like glycosyltransferase
MTMIFEHLGRPTRPDFFGCESANTDRRGAVPECNTWKDDCLCVLLLVLAWISATILVDPVGEFPLNDDWAFASVVRTLVQTGELHIPGWAAMNLIAQVAWGALFCLPFGFSFTALRLSTLILGLAGVLATYGLLREAQAPPKLSLFGSLVLGFSPIYFALSFTFMTDVPFAALAAISSWLLLRGLHRDSWIQMTAGLVFAGLAILIRQVGLAIPIAFSAAYLAKHGFARRRIFVMIFTVSAAFALQFAYEAWLRLTNHLPRGFGRQITALYHQLQRPLYDVAGDALTITSYSFVYAGLFLFAFLIASPGLKVRRKWPPLTAALAITSGVLTVIASRWGKLMPMRGNILTNAGIGWDPITAPIAFWTAVTFVAIIGAILLFVALTRGLIGFLIRNKIQNSYLLGFSLALIAISFTPLPFLGLDWQGFYDRYVIVFLPWLMLTTVAIGKPINYFSFRTIGGIIGITTLLATSVFSIAATHDYLASHRTVWLALNNLMNDAGVKPQQIDGGFEFNGWYLYADDFRTTPTKSWYWVVDDEYVVSPSSRQGYTKLQTFPVRRWLPWGTADILVQRRTSQEPGAVSFR